MMQPFESNVWTGKGNEGKENDGKGDEIIERDGNGTIREGKRRAEKGMRQIKQSCELNERGRKGWR